MMTSSGVGRLASGANGVVSRFTHPSASKSGELGTGTRPGLGWAGSLSLSRLRLRRLVGSCEYPPSPLPWDLSPLPWDSSTGAGVNPAPCALELIALLGLNAPRRVPGVLLRVRQLVPRPTRPCGVDSATAERPPAEPVGCGSPLCGCPGLNPDPEAPEPSPESSWFIPPSLSASTGPDETPLPPASVGLLAWMGSPLSSGSPAASNSSAIRRLILRSCSAL